MGDTEKDRPERTFWFTIARGFAYFMTALFFPVTYHGLQNYELNAPYIIIANHKHWFDPLLVGVKVKRYEVRYLGKKELAANRFTKWITGKLHMIVVDRHNSDLSAMRACVNTVRQGHVLGIFPEGTRCKDSTMSHLESGAAFIALRCKVPLVPVLVDKPAKLWRRVNVYVGKPIETADLYTQPADASTVALLLDRMRNAVLALAPQKTV